LPLLLLWEVLVSWVKTWRSIRIPLYHVDP
jgi:hypothetical protein